LIERAWHEHFGLTKILWNSIASSLEDLVISSPHAGDALARSCKAFRSRSGDGESEKGVVIKTHNGPATFGESMVKTGRIAPEHGRALARVLKTRLRADYTAEVPSLDEVRRARERGSGNPARRLARNPRGR
jgi:hypothetical protein